MNDAKRALRHQMKQLRKSLDADQVAERSAAITARVLALPEVQGATGVFVYESFRKEVRTQELIAAFVAAGKRVAVPKVVGDGVMHASIPGLYEVCITPGLAFDLHGGRIGYGGGYYDRWLQTHPDTVAIAVCYDEQVLDRVPMDVHDTPISVIVTPSRIHRVSRPQTR